MDIVDTTAATDTTTDKYDAIEKIALNLEQAIAIADAVRPPRQIVPRAPIPDNPATSGPFNRTPKIPTAPESN
jgi:hypothetical protein